MTRTRSLVITALGTSRTEAALLWTTSWPSAVTMKSASRAAPFGLSEDVGMAPKKRAAQAPASSIPKSTDAPDSAAGTSCVGAAYAAADTSPEISASPIGRALG